MKTFAETVQIGIFKTLFTALKEISNEIPLKFTEDGIFIKFRDEQKTIISDVELYKNGFERYECSEVNSTKVDITDIIKILKCTNDERLLTLTLDNYADNAIGGPQLVIGFGRSTETFRFDIMDNNEDDIPSLNLKLFPVEIEIPTQDLQYIFTKLKVITDTYLEVIYKDRKLTFNAKNVTNSGTITRSETTEHPIRIITDNTVKGPNIIRIKLSIERLINITKCTTLSKTVKIFLETGERIYFEYEIGNIGKVKMGLSGRY